MGMIIKPLVTEKMTAISEKFNRFGFIVRPEANKLEIKSEIEALYNVTVVDVILSVTQERTRAVILNQVLSMDVLMLIKKLSLH